MRMQVRVAGWVLACVVLAGGGGPARGQTKEEIAELEALYAKAEGLRAKGKLGEAARAYEELLLRSDTLLEKEHLATAVALHTLANLYLDLEQHAKAEPLYRRGLAIREARHGKDHPEVADSLTGLAKLCYYLGRYAEAEPLYRRGLAIREARHGKDHPAVADSLNGLAVLCEDLGRYAEAESLHRRGLAIHEARFGKDHPAVAQSQYNLGILYQAMGRYAEAESLYSRSLAIYEARHGKDHLTVADCLNVLANLHHSQGRYAEAEPLYRRSLAIREARLGKDAPRIAGSLNDLAVLYKDLGRYAEAEPLLRRGLAIREARLGKDHPAVANSLSHLAGLYRSLGRYTEAESLYRRSLAICEAKLGKDHPDVARSLYSLAALSIDQGQTTEATDLLHRERQLSRRHASRVLPALPRREQAAFLAVTERERVCRALFLALARPKDASLPARSAEWLLNGKAVAEEALSQSVLLARDSADPAVGKFVAELGLARRELARLSLATPPAGQEKAHRQAVEAQASREQDLAARLTAAGGTSVASADWIDLPTLHKSLPTGAVLIDVARIDFFEPAGKGWQPARYAAWVTPTKGDVRLIDLGFADVIDAAVKDVRVALESAHRLIRARGEPAAEAALREPLAKLSKLVLAPLLPHVGEAKRWVVSPDGNLWLVPWEILLLADGKYAVEKHTLSYVSSGRDLVTASQWKGKPGRPLVVADPDFDLDSNTARAEAARLLAKREADEEVRGLSRLLRLGSITRLPGTRAEAAAVEKPLTSYAKQAPRLLLGKYALEALVKDAKNPRVLVLSTHGFFLPTERVKPAERPGEKAAAPPGWENPLLRCGLLFAGCNDAAKATDGDDGVLTGLEVVGMDLRGCEMVVLSACETGVGDVQNGEGVAGLRQAFRLAGAESVVSTLWQVPDRSSAQLMTLFFQGLAKGKDRASALREAQLKVIEERRDDSAAAHPFFWAAFTLTGR